MSQYAEKTLENMRNYYEESENGHNIVSKIVKKGIDGYIAHSILEERTCFVVCILDSDASIFTLSVYPSIHVDIPYRHMFSEYCSKVNANTKSGFFKLEGNGNVYITESQDVSNSFLTSDVIKQLEIRLLHSISIYSGELDKAAHGIIPNFDISAIIKNYFLKNLGRTESKDHGHTNVPDSFELFDDLDEKEKNDEDNIPKEVNTEEQDISIESIDDLLHILANCDDE